MGIDVPSTVTGAIQRELSAIIDNDPGGYINGARPLAGVTVEDFIEELHTPNAGAVGRVRGVSRFVVSELQAKIPPRKNSPTLPNLDDLLDYNPDEDDLLEKVAVAEPVSTVESELQASEQPKQRRDRPRKSDAPPATKKRKPRAAVKLVVPPAPEIAVVAGPTFDGVPADRNLESIVRLWPSLHPQAKRAVILYASELIVEI